MPEYKVATSPEKRSYKKLSHIEIKPVKGENGGHIVTHHYQSDGMSYKAPETHMFGKDEGSEMMAHVAKHMKVSMPEAKGEEHEGPASEVEAASEPATESVNA
jgi:hypothetical protein